MPSHRVLTRVVLLPWLFALGACGPPAREVVQDRVEPGLGDGIEWQPLSKGMATQERPRFESLGSGDTGIDFLHNEIPPDKQSQIIYASSTSGGVSIGDYDGDSLADVYLTQPFGRNRLYRNKGPFRFEDVTDRAGVDDDGLWGMGATFVDIDNDGDLDLY
ncbi:MAG: VCBS repeat-containing protein, partial [bacterium]|nr:VCBS repeat-containing protein [bacterium]